METVLVEILVGLPGSGKTYYAKEQGVHPDVCFADRSKEKAMYICTDKDVYYGCKSRTIEQIIHNHEFGYWIICHNHNWDHWIIDGLFLTNNIQHKVVDVLYNEIHKYNDIKLKIRFVYFKEDREACLYNDQARNRKKLANITIEHADYEKPDIETLQKDFPKIEFELKEKEVHKMNIFESKFLTKGSCNNEQELRSDTWCLGGTCGNCWDDTLSHIGADEQPTEFKEFDDLLMEVCPNITLLQYKKLYNSLVSIEIECESDYYGGSTENAYYKCNLKDLYNMMKEMDLINENE